MPIAPSTIRSLGETEPSLPKTELGTTWGANRTAPALTAVFRKFRRVCGAAFLNGLGGLLREFARTALFKHSIIPLSCFGIRNCDHFAFLLFFGACQARLLGYGLCCGVAKTDLKAALSVGKRKIAVANLNKVLYPAGKFTKAQVMDYYARVAPVMLPHLRNRPVTLKRFPDGIHGEAFYEKQAPAFTPEWVKTFPVPRRDPKQPPIEYILINDVATLVWAAGTASLEIHPFLHRVPAIDTPTFVAFDLDPRSEEHTSELQ